MSVQVQHDIMGTVSILPNVSHAFTGVMRLSVLLTSALCGFNVMVDCCIYVTIHSQLDFLNSFFSYVLFSYPTVTSHKVTTHKSTDCHILSCLIVMTQWHKQIHIHIHILCISGNDFLWFQASTIMRKVTFVFHGKHVI